MRKNIKKWIAVACSLTCIAAAGFGVASLVGNNVERAKAYEITLKDGDELQSEYDYGYSLSIPMGSIEGVQATKVMVVSPSGKVYDKEDLTLTEAGQYTVVWYANVGGKEVSAQKSFLVTQSAFSVNGGVEWGYVEGLEKVPGFDYNMDGVGDPDTRMDGIKVSLQPESSFTYNKAIDLSDPDVPFAHIFPYHGITNIEEAESSEDYKYHEEARNYLITLTDAYDPTNSVTIDLEWQEGRTYWNFRAGAVGQTAHGLRTKAVEGVEQVLINGELYTPYFAPGQGLTSCNVMDNHGLQLYYDTTDNCVYITFCRYTASTGYVVNERRIVADLDNEAIYPENPFKGFTTGEVYLTISAKNYVGNVANVDIASLGGVSGEDMLKVEMQDTKAPVIEVDEGLKQGNVFIALNEEIQIPSAFARDLSLPYGTKATTTVYYAYNPNSTKNVSVGLTNGKFTPTKQGLYTIVYLATDTSGNVSTATVEMQCVPGVDNKAVKLTVDAETEAMAGNYAQIPECTIEGSYSDAKALKTYVQFEDGEKVLLENDQLFLQGVGKYVLTYVYDTPFKSYTATSTIIAAASDKVSIDASILPEYFIKGAKYTLDTVYAHEYKTKEPVSVAAKTYMSKDGGEYVEVNGKVVLIDADKTVRFKYEHGGETTYSETIKVVDVGFGGALAMENYFYSEENVTCSAASDGVKYVTDGKTQNATLSYVNVLGLSSFSMDFTLLSEGKAYVAPTAVTLTLVDYYDRDNVITLRFADGGKTTKFYIDGKLAVTLEKAFLDEKISVTYNKGFTLNGVTYPWDGAFTSNKILLKVTLEEMKGATCLNISKLCDNKLTDAETDKASPVLYTPKLNTGYQPFGTVITITQASVSDLFAPYLESGLRLTVRKPDGSFATSVDGVSLNGTCPVDRGYELKLDEIGIYSVLYEYTDQNGGYCSFGYSPIVKDETSPVLTVNVVSENEVIEAAWGSTVTVASYTVYDDISVGEGLDSWICVFYPSNVVVEVANGGTFYADEKGDYTVLYYCYDEVGNYTTFAYVVRVS